LLKKKLHNLLCRRHNSWGVFCGVNYRYGDNQLCALLWISCFAWPLVLCLEHGALLMDLCGFIILYNKITTQS